MSASTSRIKGVRALQIRLELLFLLSPLSGPTHLSPSWVPGPLPWPSFVFGFGFHREPTLPGCVCRILTELESSMIQLNCVIFPTGTPTLVRSDSVYLLLFGSCVPWSWWAGRHLWSQQSQMRKLDRWSRFTVEIWDFLFNLMMNRAYEMLDICMHLYFHAVILQVFIVISVEQKKKWNSESLTCQRLDVMKGISVKTQHS